MSLTGQLLVAMPQMLDPRFARSVVYICAHSSEAGAMGLVINKLLGSLTMGELFAQLDISPSGSSSSRSVHFGGPVEGAEALSCTRPTTTRTRRWSSTTTLRSPRRSTSCARLAKDRGRARACSPSAMPAGRRVSSMPRSRPMDGFRFRRMTRSSSVPTMIRNGSVRSPSSGSI